MKSANALNSIPSLAQQAITLLFSPNYRYAFLSLMLASIGIKGFELLLNYGFLLAVNDLGLTSWSWLPFVAPYIRITLLIVLVLWLQGMTLHVSAHALFNKPIPPRALIGWGWAEIKTLFILYTIYIAYVIGGLILFIIPGLRFIILYTFAPMIAVLDHEPIRFAMAKSKSMVSKYFWPITGRLVILWIANAIALTLLSVLLTLIHPLLIVFTAALSPIMTLVLVLMYFNVRNKAKSAL